VAAALSGGALTSAAGFDEDRRQLRRRSRVEWRGAADRGGGVRSGAPRQGRGRRCRTGTGVAPSPPLGTRVEQAES
jgi:hypothetical protein